MSLSRRFALILGPLVLCAIPPITPAKAPTIKIIISGPDLPSPIEIVDPKILALSNVWTGEFLERSMRHPEKAPERLPYELAFYAKFHENDLRLVYVAYYYPDPSEKPGVIYLPGHRDPWYYLNAGSILRDGQDGKWNFASSAWEALVKPLIARQVVPRPLS
jgi:hypothetical protein